MVSNKYIKYYKNIVKNKNFFELMIKNVVDENKTFEERFLYAIYSLRILTCKPTGYFYSNILEKFFVDIAQNNDIDNYDVIYEPKSVLHVMTQCYETGGHTRVVERWIDNTKENYKNSVILLEQNDVKIPDLLISNIQTSNGNLINLNENTSIIKKAMKLREIALNYEFIVLHTHMSDPIATIAFGTEKFTRPVLFFNHADHMFWIGKTISDVVLDIRTIKSISPIYRDINNAILCPIPCDYNSNIFLSKNEARESLGIKSDEQIVLTSGTPFKYTPIGSDGIFDVIDKILSSNKKMKLIVIGANKYWNKIQNKYKSRVVLYEMMSFPEYTKHVSAADLVIDSYPMNGETTLIDAIRAKVPFLSLDVDCSGQNDFVIKSKGYCENKETLVQKTLKCLDDNSYLNELFENESTLFQQNYSKENWISIIENIYKNAPKKHSLRNIPSSKALCNIGDYSVVLERLYKKQAESLYKIYGLRNIFGIIKIKIRGYCKIYKIFLFGQNIANFKENYKNPKAIIGVRGMYE